MRFTILSASFLGGPLAALSRDVAYTCVAVRSPINFSARHRRSFDRSIKESPSNLLPCEMKKENEKIKRSKVSGYLLRKLVTLPKKKTFLTATERSSWSWWKTRHSRCELRDSKPIFIKRDAGSLPPGMKVRASARKTSAVPCKFLRGGLCWPEDTC